MWCLGDGRSLWTLRYIHTSQVKTQHRWKTFLKSYKWFRKRTFWRKTSSSNVSKLQYLKENVFHVCLYHIFYALSLLLYNYTLIAFTYTHSWPFFFFWTCLIIRTSRHQDSEIFWGNICFFGLPDFSDILWFLKGPNNRLLTVCNIYGMRNVLQTLQDCFQLFLWLYSFSRFCDDHSLRMSSTHFLGVYVQPFRLSSR